MFIHDSPACMLWTTYMAGVQRVRKRGFDPIGIMDSCEPTCGFWELNTDPLQGQVFLTPEHLSGLCFVFPTLIGKLDFLIPTPHHLLLKMMSPSHPLIELEFKSWVYSVLKSLRLHTESIRSLNLYMFLVLYKHPLKNRSFSFKSNTIYFLISYSGFLY